MISRRENFLRALRCERAQRMPVVFVIDNFNYPNDLPAELLDPFDMVRIQRYLGGDVIDRAGPSVVATRNSQVSFTATDRGDGTHVQEWDTPLGKLSGVYRHSHEAGANFVEHYSVTNTAGYDIIAAICHDTILTADEDATKATQARIDEIGDDGVLYSVGPASPVMDLMRTWVGMEQLIYDIADYPELIERTMAAMARKAYEHYELLAANTPAKLIVFWEDVTSLHLSRDTFTRYALPFYRTISDICHSHGKLLVMHTCGRFRAFYDLMLESGVDAIDWVTPPETGDVVFAEVQEAFAGRICVMGTVLPSVMRFERPDAVEAHISHILSGVDATNGFVMVPAPIGSPMENVERVKHVVAGQ